MGLLDEVEAEVQELRGFEPLLLGEPAADVEGGILQQARELVQGRVAAAMLERQVMVGKLEGGGGAVEADVLATGGVLHQEAIELQRLGVLLLLAQRRRLLLE